MRKGNLGKRCSFRANFAAHSTPRRLPQARALTVEIGARFRTDSVNQAQTPRIGATTDALGAGRLRTKAVRETLTPWT